MGIDRTIKNISKTTPSLKSLTPRGKVEENIERVQRLRGCSEVFFGEVTYKPGGRFGWRRSPNFVLVIIHEGEATVTVGAEEHFVPAGHVALTTPGHREYFALSATSPTHHSWCRVDPRRVPAQLASALASAPFCMPFTSRMQSLMELGLSLPVSDSPAVAALLDKLGEAMLHEYLAEAALAAEMAFTLPDPVRRARELIEADFSASISVSVLAKVARCTPNHLTQLFRRHLGITPSRYLWQMRVTHGIELLQQTGLTISEIAYRIGFKTPFHFSRLVKKQCKLSPRDLRARVWNHKSK